MNLSLELLAASILTAWSVWRIARIAKLLIQHGGRISVGHARALLWPGLILASVLGWVVRDTVL